MAYITEADFEAYAPSAAELDADVFAELAGRASEVIDALTFDRITKYGFDNLAEHVQAAVIKAACAQLQTMVAFGGVDAATGNSDAAKKSVSVGGYSYTLADGGNVKTMNGVPISPFAEQYLLRTGLMYRGMRIV